VPQKPACRESDKLEESRDGPRMADRDRLPVCRTEMCDYRSKSGHNDDRRHFWPN
jgi:hypothetical protein